MTMHSDYPHSFQCGVHVSGRQQFIWKKMISPQTEIFQGMFNTIINFTPKKFHTKLLSLYLTRLPIVRSGFNSVFL